MKWEDIWRNRPYAVWTRLNEVEVRRVVEGNWEEGQLSWYSGSNCGKLFRGVRTGDGYVLAFLPLGIVASYRAGPYLRLRIEQWSGWTRVRVERLWLWQDCYVRLMLWFGLAVGIPVWILQQFAPVAWVATAIGIVFLIAEGVVWGKMRERLLVLLDGKEEA